MRINRTPRQRFFTTLGNEVLRDNRLSFCARGVLAHLLSLPDGQRGDIRTLAERTPEGRERVASAMRELERFGYLRRTVRRTPAGRIYTEVEVFDTPTDPSTQVTSQPGFPGSDSPNITPDGDQIFKEQVEETTLPHQPEPVHKHEEAKPGREGVDVVETAKSVAVLARVSRSEPRLPLGPVEAVSLAPLVTQWHRRGASDLHIIGTLTAGLPKTVHCPAALIRDRLQRKMPAERVETQARTECTECAAPIAVAGLCRRCKEPGSGGSTHRDDHADVGVRGAALVRAAFVVATRSESAGKSCPALRRAP